MLINPYRCVINRDNYYVEFVLLIEQPNGSSAPDDYELKHGETLIEAPYPLNMIAPRWNGAEWEETATLEEIEAAKYKQQQIIKETVSDLEIAFAEYVIETDARLTELEAKIDA